MQPTTEEIEKYGTPIEDSQGSNRSKETFSYHGREMPKFRFYELNGEDFAVPTKEYKEYLKEQQEKQMLGQEGDFKRSLSDYIGADAPGNLPKLRRYVDEFATKFCRHSLYIWSRFNSTQKTTVSRALIKEIKEKHKDVVCAFVLANTLVNDLKNYDFSDDAKQRVELYKEVSFLVVDDAFAADKVTRFSSGYQTTFLDTFLRERLEVYKKATVFTSNIPVKEIGRVWGASVEALVNRNVFEMEFNDVLGKDTDFDVKHIFD